VETGDLLLISSRSILLCSQEVLLDRAFTDDYSINRKVNRMIDNIDRQILDILQNEARMANAEIARKVGLAPSAVLERIRKLEDRGIIRGYHTDIDPRALDFGLTVFVAVRTSECSSEAEEMLAAIPEVLEVHDVAGDDCFLLKIRTKDAEALSQLHREKIRPIPTVIGTRTTVVLKTFKETTGLPIGQVEEGKKGRK
jgi:Lrp/AsnC family leucine-responsive transcriptional regulator